MIALKKVLVASDFSEPSDAALAYGRELARSFGAQLVVLHVVENLLTHVVGGDGFVLTDPDVQAAVEAEGKKRVDGLISDEDRLVLRAQGVIVTSNAPAFAIVDYAKSSAINLIVIGTHGRGAMAHLLMGSVAEHVVRIAPCPVLTVRHPEREFVLPDALMAVTKAAR
ncbi:MAG: universal stress protein [Acidobacteria bacterium]|nr:MAG: universal stress protein [Acidobacteriota bacterium]